ncbi:MAG: hypothetical protein HAW58_02255, partial [Candidatus Thioglobus sp.]|nr:hypothetical protein [Candidatus Thioglobus sp.]
MPHQRQRPNYQGCWEGGVCYPPQQKTLQIPLVAKVLGQSISNNSNTF